MFFAGIEKVVDPHWSAKGFLLGAKTFPALYAWFAAPTNIWWVNPLNAWGITLVGVALLLGVAVRPAAFAGAALVMLYYFPQYTFPYVPHGFIVDEHIIYAAAFIFIAYFPPAHRFGINNLVRDSFISRLPIFRSII